MNGSEYRGFRIFRVGAEWFLSELAGKRRMFGPYQSELFARLKVDELTVPKIEVII